MRMAAALAGLALVACAGVAGAGESSPTLALNVWTKKPWGEVYAAEFKHAPYPDDSRRTGYTNRRGDHFPAEGHYDDATVAIAIPAGYRATAHADIVVHFHGHGNTVANALEQFRLGEQLEASGRNAVLVLPQGPKLAPDSGGGKLEKPGQFTLFLSETLDLLEREGRVMPGARVRHVILSAHSGGYRVAGMILAKGGATDSIREAWLFDAAYAQLDELAAPFASPDSGRRLRSIFTDHLANENIGLMSRLSLRGAPVFVVHDDHLSTAGTTAGAFAAFPFHSEGAEPGKDELAQILGAQPNLFIHTGLSHSGLVMETRYFERFARASANLEGR